MRKYLVILLAAILAALVLGAAGCANRQAATSTTMSQSAAEGQAIVENKTLILATTTSTKDTGLLDVLLPEFTEKTGITVKPIAVGTGEALEMGKRGDADVLLVHARASEDAFMESGDGSIREAVMYNDFVLIGPANDPAGAKGSSDAAAAFKKAADAQATFVSRGDDSGTHKKELSIWEKAGVTPEGGWYISTGQGMAATIRIANEKLGYTLTDRGTFLVQKDNTDLVIVTEKSEDLLNPYGVIAVNPEKHSKVNFEGAKAFIDFLTSGEGQKMIGEFGKDTYGQALFVPDAN